MTHILLISDTERVKRVFESLVKKDSLQLRTATTLVQADQELSAQRPQFVFVQSRVSGFSGEIVLRYLNKTLPKEAKIVLLAGDAEEMRQMQRQAELCLDLTLDDEALAGAIDDILSGVSRPRQAVAPDSSAPGSSVPAQIKEQSKVGRGPKAGPGAMQGDTAKAPEPVRGKPKKKQPKSPDKVAPLPAEQQPTELQPPDGGADGGQSFAEIMRRASVKEKQNDPGPHPDLAPLPGLSDPFGPTQPFRPVSVGEYTSGEPIADAIRRTQKKTKRPLWPFFSLALALLAGISVFSYFGGMKTAPPQPAGAPHPISGSSQLPSHPAPAGTTAQVPSLKVVPAPALTPPAASAASTAKSREHSAAIVAAVPVEKKTDKPIPKSAAKPEAQPSVKPATEQVAKPVANSGVKPEAKSVLKPGLKSLPPIVAETKFDAAYGKAHPGWQRFLGTRVEFKVFKEAGLYRALQVLERNGEPIPDQLFKRILLEFGRVDSYQVKSTGEKGKYLMEQGVTKGDVALTIYRNKSDHRMKAFVLYYR